MHRYEPIHHSPERHPDGETRAAAPLRRRRDERGVALIITILVMMVVGVLGLSLLAFSVTEENLAATYRDEVQVQLVAEAGVRIVQRMFNNPASDLVPQYAASPATWEWDGESALNTMGISRASRPGRGTYSGPGNQLFKGPFHDSWAQVFGGVRSSDLFDLRFSCQGISSADCFLDQKINSLFEDTSAAGWNTKITEIKLFAPPIHAGRLYGHGTVVVTATKYHPSGRVVARETMEGILGQDTTQPAIMADGHIDIGSSSRFCGESPGCETIHANGNLTTDSGTYASGGDPPFQATGSVNASGSTVTPPGESGVDRIEPPKINPWDLVYKPTTAASRSKYYLLTTRALDAVWTDDDPDNNPAPRSCGNSFCQDYNLELEIDGSASPARSTTGQLRIYKWDETNSEWDLHAGPATAGSPGGTLSISPSAASDETMDIEAYSYADTAVSGTGDAADAPYITTNLIWTVIKIKSPCQPDADSDDIQGITVLVDGNLWAEGQLGHNRSAAEPAWKASLISAGSIFIKSSADVDPALENRVMFIAGRDLLIESSFNNDFNNSYCNTAPDYSNPPAFGSEAGDASAVIAAHEQILLQSSSKLVGIVVAENEVNFDEGRDINGFKTPSSSDMGGNALKIASSSHHSYLCGFPQWPWAVEGATKILAMSSTP